MAEEPPLFSPKKGPSSPELMRQPMNFHSSREERERLYPVRKAPDSRARRRAIRRMMLLDGGLVLLCLAVATPLLLRGGSASWENGLVAANEGELCHVRLYLRGPSREVAATVTLAGEQRSATLSARDVAKGVWTEWTFPRQASGAVVRASARAGRKELRMRALVP